MSDSAKKYTIAVIPGDGIGKEVTPWAQKALEKAAEGIEGKTGTRVQM